MGVIRRRKDDRPAPVVDLFRCENSLNPQDFREAFNAVCGAAPVTRSGFDPTPGDFGIDVAELYRRWLTE